MKKILVACACFVSLAVHAAAAQIVPERVVMVGDHSAPSNGDQLAFEGAKGCIYTGTVDGQRLEVIDREICPGVTTMVTLVVPLDRKSGFTETLTSNIFTEWLTESSRNYYLFPMKAAGDTQSPTMN
ncbi:hypothetical protein [Pseudomonas sp. Irchel 3E13]|uniref:hypothetical protein n=1 Tax=Pseudomonas sp. Irchel 3E13 TaxID=2008975 RepID=UPI00117BC013|nr:hypothetical protein [Pseudomonas sp. Irchel 3E13]